MKDFYKTLGVKEDASEEEIRERWIELTKQYHPDRSEESTSDEKIREINEAYQVLKHSSTRVEYDLKRAFNPGDRERKGTVHFKRWGVPASILIILIIVSVIYIRNHQPPRSSKPIVSKKIDSINQINQINQKDRTGQRNEINQTNQTNQIDEMNQTSRKNLTTQSPDGVRQPVAASTHPRMSASSHQSIVASSHQPIAASIPKHIDVKTAQPRVTKTNQVNERNQTDERDQKDQTNQKDETSVKNPTSPTIAIAVAIKEVQLPQAPQNSITPLPNDVVANKPATFINKTDQKNQRNQINEVNQTDQRKQTNQTNLNIEVAQFKPPSLLAAEDEVKKFFNDYVNYYNRKDAKGILSLFSAKAIQNQKDGLEEILKIYADFFSEGQAIRYSLQDMKIEIYQNVVEVKGRYKIDQIVKETGEKEVWKGPIRWVLIKEDGKLKILSMDYKHQRPL